LVFSALCSEGAEPAEARIPGFGSWRGFGVGTYIIEKQIYRGAKYHVDGVEYRKTVLADVGDSGAAKFQDYTSETPAGPWKISTAHSDVAPGRPGERRVSESLAEEDVTAGAQTFRCAVTVTIQTDDWGKLTITEWTDKQSGVVLRQQRQHEGQDRKGRPSRWTASLVTTGVEKRFCGRRGICVLCARASVVSGNGGQWSRTWATSKVPRTARRDGERQEQRRAARVGGRVGRVGP
jgi:hypothetical protein